MFESSFLICPPRAANFPQRASRPKTLRRRYLHHSEGICRCNFVVSPACYNAISPDIQMQVLNF